MNKFYLISLVFVISIFSSIASAETFLLQDYTVSSTCKEQLNNSRITTFKKSDFDLDELFVVHRSTKPQINVTNINFAPLHNGWLIENGEQRLVHCLTFGPSFISFALTERGKRYLMFIEDEFDVTELHLHSFIGCGTSCHFARVETIIFFNEGGMKPIYDHVEDTFPTEYPSRWFRSYLTEAEREVFDKIIVDG